MPRKSKDVHTSPKTAGQQNLPKDYHLKHEDSEQSMKGIMPIYKQGMKNRQDYKGKWTEELLEKEIQAYFDYCLAHDVKLAKVGISLWLGISKSQMYEWAREPGKYTFKSHLINQAFDIVELSYIGRSEKYPTANIFLLKSSHGHIETSKVDIQSTNNAVGADDIQDVISKMGLDKKE